MRERYQRTSVKPRKTDCGIFLCYRTCGVQPAGDCGVGWTPGRPRRHRDALSRVHVRDRQGVALRLLSAPKPDQTRPLGWLPEPCNRSIGATTSGTTHSTALDVTDEALSNHRGQDSWPVFLASPHQRGQPPQGDLSSHGVPAHWHLQERFHALPEQRLRHRHAPRLGRRCLPHRSTQATLSSLSTDHPERPA